MNPVRVTHQSVTKGLPRGRQRLTPDLKRHQYCAVPDFGAQIELQPPASERVMWCDVIVPEWVRCHIL
ncbi:MAG TPA: hypothetical protein VE398_04865 [Acidobacteriota bacterium]|nr:hypothetical protein [Acidobacteriota bacterium]